MPSKNSSVFEPGASLTYALRIAGRWLTTAAVTHDRFALAVDDVDADVDLDVEELLDRLADLDLVGSPIDLEADRVLTLLHERGLLGDAAGDRMISRAFMTAPPQATGRAGSEATIQRWLSTS